MTKFNIIYADPPWQFKNRNTGGSLKSGANTHYPTMIIEDICNIPVEKFAAKDCVLFMWWVGSMPDEALMVVRRWGFKLKTMTGFTWVKLTKMRKKFFGMGFWTRQGSENCLIAVKGKPKRINAAIRAVVEAEIGIHSEKPNIFRKLIIELMGDLPRIELFARQATSGWYIWGNEVKSDISLDKEANYGQK